MTTSTAGAGRAARYASLGCALLAYAWLAWATAWLSDDAFISLRTAANWLDGYGLTWNVDERVQTSTHPLWLFALTAAHGLSGEPFYSALYLSWAVSCAAVAVLLFAMPGALAEKLFSVLVLGFSRAFVDFSSSGLENPLTHLSIAAFACVYFAWPPSARRTTALASIVGLCAVNRLDTLLLFAPALATCVSRPQLTRDLARLSWSALPIALWEAFSIIYYGFPFPNTAYAKLTQGAASDVSRFADGTGYLADSLAVDPLTLCAIAGCVAIAARKRDARRLWLLAGAGLYVGYSVSIGGDFMSGRFFAAPLFLSICCLATSDWLQFGTERAALAVLAVALVLLGSTPPPFTGADFGAVEAKDPHLRGAIHDERAMFFQISSLRNARRMNPSRSDHPWARIGKRLKTEAVADPSSRVRVVDAIGYAGYYAGPGVHLVDHWALADALLARLPAVLGRFGHYPRVIPRGYLASLRSGHNRIADDKLARYYDQLALVLRDPLWSARRLRAIWRLNTGAYDDLLDGYAYRRTPRFSPRLRLTNPTNYACVTAYVWDGGFSSYVLDAASTPGATYDVHWDISPAGARLRTPIAKPSALLDGLHERGVFAISVAFSEAPGAAFREIYELRFPYLIAHGQLVMQRQAWTASNRDFPRAPWKDVDADVDAVIQLVAE